MRIKNDLTGDLGKLSERGVLPSGRAPEFKNKPIKQDERPMALDSIGYFAWSLVISYAALQLLLLIWFLRGI